MGRQVVHGKEIPWNLFTPKAPYAGKAGGFLHKFSSLSQLLSVPTMTLST